MEIAFNKPAVDVSGWESVLIHLGLNVGSQVTAENIRDIINNDIAKMDEQNSLKVVDTQAKYDHKYIKALFRRIKSDFDGVLSGTQEVEYRIDGAKSNIRVGAGTYTAEGDVNNLADLDILLRDAVGEFKFKKLLDDLESMPDDVSLHTNMVIHELKQNGVEVMIDDRRASFVTKLYDDWNGDYLMDNSWWLPYTERSLKMAIIIYDVILDYLQAIPSFDEDEFWAELESNDITFMLNFEYGNSMGDTMDTRNNLVGMVKNYLTTPRRSPLPLR